MDPLTCPSLSSKAGGGESASSGPTCIAVFPELPLPFSSGGDLVFSEGRGEAVFSACVCAGTTPVE